jgi:hypothetical protein
LKPNTQFLIDAAFMNATCKPLIKNAGSDVLSQLLTDVVGYVRQHIKADGTTEEKVVAITDIVIPGLIAGFGHPWIAIIIKLAESYAGLSFGTILTNAWHELMPHAQTGNVAPSAVDGILQSILPSEPTTAANIRDFKLYSLGISHQMTSYAATKPVATSLLGKIVGWMLKATLAAAGIMVLGDIANKLTGHTDVGPTASGLPAWLHSGPAIRVSTQTVLKQNPAYEPEHHNQSSSWMVSTPPSQIAPVIVAWATSIYPDLKGHENLITSASQFQYVVSEIQKDNAANATPYTFIPTAYSSKKSVVDIFIDQVAAQYQQLAPQSAKPSQVTTPTQPKGDAA